MADVDNPDPDLAAAPEPDDASGLGAVCRGAFLTCTTFAVSFGLMVLFRCSLNASTAVQVLALVGLGVAFCGIIFGPFFCADTLASCVHGNYEGRQQPCVTNVDSSPSTVIDRLEQHRSPYCT
jgi:hypothetical protein